MLAQSYQRLILAVGRANVLLLSRAVPPVPSGATRSVALKRAAKRRANERHGVGCCKELAGPPPLASKRRLADASFFACTCPPPMPLARSQPDGSPTFMQLPKHVKIGTQVPGQQ